VAVTEGWPVFLLRIPEIHHLRSAILIVFWSYSSVPPTESCYSIYQV